ncbi:unnamed protein product [Phytomonas sp. EM1]|nr:unnamed protein product [Phytomonas sp. EM1]|eukprot:CCW61846.1 unnamed protein product [Phytomonas sp. isolate EM1]
MRHRQSNPKSNSNQPVPDLIQRDVLSSSEQDKVLVYFANSLRTSAMLLRVLACLHSFLAFVYTGFLFSGTVFASTALGPEERERLSRLLNVTTLMKATPPSIATGNSNAPHPSRLDQQTALQGLINGVTTSWGSMTIPLSVFCTLISIFLLLLGGYGCWKACLALRVSTEELLRMAPGNPHEEVRVDASKVPRPWGGAGRRSWNPKSPYFQYGISICASIQALVWAFAMMKANHATRELYGRIDPSLAPKLWFGIAGSFTEIITVFWQPLFHWFIGSMIQSMFTTREDLFSLSKARYVFEKL